MQEVPRLASPTRDDAATGTAGGGLLGLFSRGVAWKVGAQSISQTARLVATIVLVHLLAPSAYGLAAMALVLAGFAVAFSDLGFGAALVQRPILTSVDISTAFWISLAAGAAFTVLTALAAVPLAEAYAQPRAAALILGLSPIFVLDSLATTQRALLARKVDFRSLELRSLVGAVVGSSVAIGAALDGAGAWSLIVQELVTAVASTLLLWRLASWRPSFAFSRQSCRDLGGFAWRSMGTRLLNDVNDTADNVLVGRFLGAGPLGIYTVTYKTALRPMANFIRPLQEVVFPVLSLAQDDVRLVAQAWLRVTRITSALTFPLLAGVAVLAPEFVHVVLGGRWASAATVLQILTIVGAIQALTATIWSVLGALNQIKTSLRLAGARTALNVTAFAVGLHWGIKGVAAAYAASSVVTFVPIVWLTSRRVGLPVMASFRVLGGVSQATAVMSLALVLFRRLAIDEGMGASLRLVTLIAAGGAVYGVTLWWRDRALRDDVLRLVGSWWPRSAAPLASPRAVP